MSQDNKKPSQNPFAENNNDYDHIQSSQAQDLPVVNVYVPQPKKSIFPWVLLGLVALVFIGMLASCAALVKATSSSISSLSSSSAHDYQVLPGKEGIAVYHMDASISASSGTTPEQIRKIIKRVEEQDSIKALVVRVNCPGGTVAASEEIAGYIKNCSKPVVFSVSDLCASGAYMAASQADAILAMPSSSVGSIGVIMQTLDISELLEKLGIKMGSIKSAQEKDAGALYRSLSDEERARLQQEISELNSMFISLVAQGRSLDYDKVESLATGTTYMGSKALEYGLIDELGDFQAALDRAAELAGVDPALVTEVSLDPTPSFFESFSPFELSTKLDPAELFKEGKHQYRAE